MKKKLKSNRVCRTLLHKTYIKLLQHTFKFIKIYYTKDRDIHPKRDPELYGSLVTECLLSDLRKKKNILKRLFLKFQQYEFYEDYFVPRELLQLLFMPCFRKMEYYILLQHHILENGAIFQLELQNYFSYIKKELNSYLFNIEKTYNLLNLRNNFYLNNNMRLVNFRIRDFTKKRVLKTKYQEIEGFKHQSLAIQILLLKEISEAKTKKKIKKLCYDLTSFISRPDELFCGYV